MLYDLLLYVVTARADYAFDLTGGVSLRVYHFRGGAEGFRLPSYLKMRDASLASAGHD